MKLPILSTLVISLLACADLGCTKKQEDRAATAAGSGSATAAAAAPAPKPSAEPVDTCGLLTKEQVEAVLGGPLEGEPTKGQPQGSLLGECTWTAGKLTTSVSARPADEFDATARKGTEVPGIGEKAMQTTSGMLIKVPGKHYFLHVMVVSMNGLDDAKALEVAQAMAPSLK